MGETNVSWFLAMQDFFAKLGNTFVQLTSCLRLPEDGSEEIASYVERHSKALTVEHRDSMGLLAATFTGRDDKARELLFRPWTNINVQYANGNTPLILAIQGNQDMIVSMLLDHPMINVNLRGLDGYTALIRACQERADYVGLLLQSRPEVNVNIATYFGTTALTYAIRCGNTMAVSLLLQRPDIDVNLQSKSGENALIEALAYRRFEVIQLLLARRDTEVDIVDDTERTPLIMAAQYGYPNMARQLLFSGSDPLAEDDQGHNALHYAIKRANTEIVDYLMETLSTPQPLMRLCRSLIRRYLRANKLGYGRGKLRTIIYKIPKYDLPKIMKRYLAYDP